MSINSVIDLRSDTVTVPTPAMREAMAGAVVGDDVFGEDPTVNALQELAAERLGFEAGLFVASGTQGNLIAMMVHGGKGDEAIVGDQAHLYLYEQGGLASIAGINPRPLVNQPDGTLRLDQIEAAIRGDDAHFPVTRIIALENTHNRMGGAVLSVEYTRRVADFAHARGIALHVDGARVFNAAAALDIPVRDLTSPADSATFCLSKALSAPVGSVLCGSRAFIRAAHRRRKVLGGGMRQAGILAAAGIVALETMPQRLRDDHANARALSAGLAGIPGLRVVGDVPSNMVYVDLDPALPFDAVELTRRLAKHRIKVVATFARRIRCVTHCWISADDIREALQVFAEVARTDAPSASTGRAQSY
ncbi:MAG: low-specificity L-threonine aldolase [Thermoflexales bacterium]|nr:low-specificity L-threonine aldolase [Thermoflexales bacterium]